MNSCVAIEESLAVLLLSYSSHRPSLRPKLFDSAGNSTLSLGRTSAFTVCAAASDTLRRSHSRQRIEGPKRQLALPVQPLDLDARRGLYSG